MDGAGHAFGRITESVMSAVAADHARGPSLTSA